MEQGVLGSRSDRATLWRANGTGTISSFEPLQGEDFAKLTSTGST